MLSSYKIFIAMALLFILSATASVIPQRDSLLPRDDTVGSQHESIASTDKSARRTCPDQCPMNYEPVCAKNDCGEYMTFSNACMLGVHNCKNKHDQYTVLSNGECLH